MEIKGDSQEEAKNQAKLVPDRTEGGSEINANVDSQGEYHEGEAPQDESVKGESITISVLIPLGILYDGGP